MIPYIEGYKCGIMDIREFFSYSHHRYRCKKSERESTIICQPDIATHEVTVNKDKNNSSTDAKIHICKYCDKTFCRRDMLLRHQKRKTPCSTTHPLYSKDEHTQVCMYCNKYTKANRSKEQFTKHQYYCKTKHNGLSHEQRTLQTFEKYQLAADTSLKNEVQELRKEIKKLNEKTTTPTIINNNITIDNVYASMFQVVGDRFASCFDQTKPISAYPWTSDPKELILLAMDKRTKSCQANSVKELAIRIGANALHACKFSSEINESGTVIRTQKQGTNKIVTNNIDDFATRFNRTSQASIGEIEFLLDCEEPSFKNFELQKNKAITSFEGLDDSSEMIDATKQMLYQVICNGIRNPETCKTNTTITISGETIMSTDYDT